MSNRKLPKAPINAEQVRLIVVDSFCGAGGFTHGVETAVDKQGNRVAVVIVGINHDAKAIESHAQNHPETKHFVEDIRDESLPLRILAYANQARLQYPNAKLLFHASLECTNFSNAKGGKPRDADSRSLAEFMPFYLEILKPDYFTVENVREFMSWGPLDENGKPVSRKKGEDYVRWYQGIESMGYRFDYRLHNTADFGANTSRTRFFAIFARPELPIAWPEPTHAKDPAKSAVFGKLLQKWRPIRECLDLDDKGKTIFREKPLSEKTLERIFEGLVRHVGNGDRSFLMKYFTGTGMTYAADQPAATVTAVDHNSLVSVQPFVMQSNGGLPSAKSYSSESPSRVITTADNQIVVTPEPFAMTYNSGDPEHRVKSMDDPAQTLTTENTIALVQPEPFCIKYYGISDPFGMKSPCCTLTTADRVGLVQSESFVSLYYSQGQQHQSVESPSAALTTVPKHRLVSAEFIDQQYGKSKPSSVHEPAKCITVNPHSALIQAFIVDPQWGGHSHSLDKPAHTIIARQDKAPASMVTPEWLLTNMHQNAGSTLDEAAPTLLTGNHHYLMTTNFSNIGRDLDKPSPTITADRHWAYVMTVESGAVPAILVYETDTPAMRKIKAFMAEYGIVDILMRMLKVLELKLIQGFPAEYYLAGSQTDQKKFIGNSVPPKYVKAWMEAMAEALAGLFQPSLFA